MNTLFESFSLNKEKVDNFLIKNESILAGGSVLSVYNNEEIFNGDLDFFVKVSQNIEDEICWDKVLNSFLEILPDFYKTNNPYGVFECHNLKKTLINQDIEYLGNNRFKGKFYKIYTYQFEDKKIQLIQTSIEYDELVRLFDFSFCATYYDGVEMDSLYPNLTSKKVGFVMNELTEKEKTIRLIKYKERGYTIFEKILTLDE
jgi:hypothetical protein